MTSNFDSRPGAPSDSRNSPERELSGAPAESTYESTKSELTPAHITWLGIGLEVALAGIALVLAWFGFYYRQQPLTKLFQLEWIEFSKWSLLGLLGLGLLFLAIQRSRLKTIREFRQYILESIAPMFDGVSTIQVAVISVSAGIGEELLFRWAIQGGLQTWWPTEIGTIVALATASILFGFCHAVTRLYILFAAVAGVILGGVMILAGSVVPAMVAHAVFDFGAIKYYQRQSKTVVAALR